MKKFETDEQLDVDEEKITAALHEGWDRLDNHIQAFTPELDWFQQQIQQRQVGNRKRLVLELGLFVIVAVILLSLFISLTVWAPAIFLIIQLIAVLIVPFVLVSLLRKRVEA
jgi:Flp pilus assembly protein TadB